MIKKITGISLIIAGCLLLVVLLSKGMIFPHISGPIVFVLVGIILLIFKRKRKLNE